MGNPLDEQVGGDHYKNMKIQPIDYNHVNALGYCEGNIVKYVSRWKSKNGVEDLKKAMHYLQVLIHFVEEEVKRARTKLPRPGQPGWDLPEPTVSGWENK